MRRQSWYEAKSLRYSHLLGTGSLEQVLVIALQQKYQKKKIYSIHQLTESNEDEWLQVRLPKVLVEKIERLRSRRLERRPGNVSLGLYVADLLKETLESERDRLESDPILEIYLVETNKVFIKDNRTGKVVELDIDSSRELFCKEDSSKNCVHIGFAWGSHYVSKKISFKKA